MTFLKYRPHRRHIKALFLGSKSKASASTDDLPSSTDTDDRFPVITRRGTEPTPSSPRHRAGLRSPLSTALFPFDEAMTAPATITFSQPGVRPPVFVVTSMSTPPWETLEMHSEGTKSGELIFSRRFDNVPEGDYQYKVRIGEGHWVVDESNDSAADEHGNRNNVVHVKRIPDATSVGQATEASTKRKDSVQREESAPPPDAAANAQSSPSAEPLMETSKVEQQPHEVPIPFTVVEKVAEKKPPEHSISKTGSLHEDKTKRSADAEPDVEIIKPETPVDAKEEVSPTPPSLPLLIIEKTDEKPSFGDDFGQEATSAQKFAHEQRAADATPDEVVITPDSGFAEGIESNDAEVSLLDEEAGPTLRHESFQTSPNEDDTQSSQKMDTIEEESLHSSDRASSSKIDSSQDETEDLEHAPDLEDSTFEAERAPTFSHEDFGEDEYGSETPLLPHEREALTPSISNGSVYSDHNAVFEGEPRFDYEEITPAEDSEGSPGSFFARRTRTGSIPHTLPRTDEDDEDLNDPSLELFPTSREGIMARVERISTSLPEDEVRERRHSQTASPVLAMTPQSVPSASLAPKSGSLNSVAEEEAPEIEQVPALSSPVVDATNIATTTSELNSLPTVRASHDADPLAPPPENDAKSSTTPAAEEPTDEDQQKLPFTSAVSEKTLEDPSPPEVAETSKSETIIGQPSSKQSPSNGILEQHAKEPSAHKEETTKEPHPTQSKTRSSEPSEADSIQKNDGANDSSKKLGALLDTIATPAKVLEPPTPPLTPKKKAEDAQGEKKELKMGEAKRDPKPTPGERSVSTPAPTNPPAKNNDHTTPFLQSFLASIFGPLKKLLGQCLGGRKSAR
ncbi:hypothetical protein EJ04DRAFT_562633 [Polyplosphaeria fusca]|uniref:AMP-activated protein kinase glycogen-binding domain-containing protein n=1 Tax=Polyplosphaeria fusca TaxID=682080 RepID=A0A9P4R3U5_9PLEO|nr:hypothetical protein EJ04DRAFT_562633 [Polyplosphaeria fusca]